MQSYVTVIYNRLYELVCLTSLTAPQTEGLVSKGNGNTGTYAGKALSSTPDRNYQYLKGKVFHIDDNAKTLSLSNALGSRLG